MTDGTYRFLSGTMAVVFGAVGLVFLFFSRDVLHFFNMLSSSLGMAEAATGGGRFYVVLAVAYMYCVTILGYCMFRQPHHPLYPQLLAHAKFASATISLLFFLAESPLLIFLVNGVVDGSIGILAAVMARSARRAST